ncbi:ABC-F family ATP-binding cassette domain-containing protein [uncultured Robinsoniella sp.]|uniref:ABC-F family ATP-binding cassette domain-containing protein n=3 Tax=Robinsoniella TaxID=588605 RepID=UPI00374FAE59
MSLLDVTELTHSFAEKALYQNAEFHLFKGEHIGVVGQNGAGKSTLISILLGEIVPDQGEVKWQSGIQIGHLDQYAVIRQDMTIVEYLQTAFAELYAMEEKMERLYQEGAEEDKEELLIRAGRYQEQLVTAEFYEIGSKIGKVATGLGLDAIGLDQQLEKLSGGQRAKVILAKLLLAKPEVLLLDEPTNFLDKEHVDWLSEFLCSFEGAYVVVSHDFEFLEKVTTGILDIEFGTVRKYNGSYLKFLDQKVHLREDYIRQYHAQQRKIEKTEAYIRKNKAGVNAKMARGRQKQLDRLERIAPPNFTTKPVIQFQETEISPGKALTVSNLEIGYYYPLLSKISFVVNGGQKLVITGFNGIGKSTLLKTLIGKIPKLAGGFKFLDQVKIGYYEQDLRWEDPNRTPLQIISDRYPSMKNKEVRKALARCGVKEEHVLRGIESLSGGEQSKVKLCRLLLSPCNFLIMDEPTNHLDQDAKEALKEALMKFEGSVILVSHEEKFYRGWTDKILDIEKEIL